MAPTVTVPSAAMRRPSTLIPGSARPATALGTNVPLTSMAGAAWLVSTRRLLTSRWPMLATAG